MVGNVHFFYSILLLILLLTGNLQYWSRTNRGSCIYSSTYRDSNKCETAVSNSPVWTWLLAAGRRLVLLPQDKLTSAPLCSSPAEQRLSTHPGIARCCNRSMTDIELSSTLRFSWGEKSLIWTKWDIDWVGSSSWDTLHHLCVTRAKKKKETLQDTLHAYISHNALK